MSKVQPSVFGCGLIALDLILNEGESTPTKASAFVGGSCGNVLTILSYLGWNTYPLAQLSNNSATRLLLQDLTRWNVNINYLSISNTGITPVIIHRIFKNNLKHRFEFKNPITNDWLPRYKPATKKYAFSSITSFPQSSVFYFDRINSATLSLAAKSRQDGAIVVFEPSSIKDKVLFDKAVSLSHIVKLSDERIPAYRELYPVSVSTIELITLGRDGVMYRTKNSNNLWRTLPPYSVSTVLDTAGAGDWCTAGVIHFMLSNSISPSDCVIEDIEVAVNIGQSMGAINCCFTGARGSMYHMTADHFERLALRLMKDRKIDNIQGYSNTRSEYLSQSSHITYEELFI